MTQEEIDALISSAEDGEHSEELLEALEEGEEEAEDLQDVDESELLLEDANVSPRMEMLYDLQLPVSIELGRTNMLIREILRLGRGSVVEFDKLVSEPVDVLVNGKKIAEGEVVVIDKHFGIRITTLVDSSTGGRTRK